MILKAVQIENYRSIEDTGEFKIDPVTCLVGKNEAGKSAILQALYTLNPIYDKDAKFNDVIDYPRRNWSEYSLERREDDPDNVVTTKWVLDAAEIASINKALGAGALMSPEFTAQKGYNNSLVFGMTSDQSTNVKHWIGQSSLHGEEKELLKSAKSISQLFEAIGAIREPSERVTQLRAQLESVFPDHLLKRAVIGQLMQRMPKFLHVPEYNTMPGKVSVEAILQRQGAETLSAEDRVFIALTKLAGRTLEEIRGIQTFEELNAEMEAISNRISKEMFDFWTQNRHLHIEFRFTEGMPADPPPFNAGKVFRTRIRNERHQVSVDFDERSTGFIWFFSFLVWFSQVKSEYGDNIIILLDEPGLGLHAKAQNDLLRYIKEKLEPVHQVIYSAHSPFMIDSGELLRVRTVEDVFETDEAGTTIEILGTKVGDEVLSTDPDTVFPLQAALGYEITQSLFVGEHTLLVEGPSDLLYLQWFSRIARERGEAGLDPRWTICPAGGITKIGSFLALFGGNKLNIAVLTDFHKGVKRKVLELRESELLQQGRVFSADMFVEADEAETEDMIGRPNYVHLVNEYYALTGSNRVPATKPADAPERVLEEVIGKFRTLAGGIPEFDHYAPAEYLISNTESLKSGLPKVDEALTRFQDLFSRVNEFLPPKGNG